jgi:hypothetical protein
MNKVLVKRSGDKLLPVYDSDKDAIMKFKEDEPFFVKPEKSRSPEFHKKMFAMFKLGHENSQKNGHLSFDGYRYLMVMRAGFFTLLHSDKGVVYLPESLAYDKMDPDKFRECYNRVLQKIIDDIGSTTDEIENEIINFL